MYMKKVSSYTYKVFAFFLTGGSSGTRSRWRLAKNHFMHSKAWRARAGRRRRCVCSTERARAGSNCVYSEHLRLYAHFLANGCFASLVVCIRESKCDAFSLLSLSCAPRIQSRRVSLLSPFPVAPLRFCIPFFFL